MLMVIFGAGASYDSAQAFQLPETLRQTWRPPLANDLFRDPNQFFGHIVGRYPKLSHILPYLREPAGGRSVEEVLESLQGEADGVPERKREFASVQFYLRDLFFEVSDKWRDATSGITNYAPLIGEVLRLNRNEEPICLVTFNYDLLLDRALESFDYKPQSPHDQFKAHPVLKLFKPHGSANWARFVDLNPDSRLLPQHLIERAESLKFTSEFVTISGIHASQTFPEGRTAFPVIAVPFQNKTEETFCWPSDHLKQLQAFLPSIARILIIGWQAREAHFAKILRNSLPKVSHVMVVGKDPTDALQTLTRFAESTALVQKANIDKAAPARGTFSFRLDRDLNCMPTRVWSSFPWREEASRTLRATVMS